MGSMRAADRAAPIRIHVKSAPVEQIYAKPEAYDLEHSAHEPDIDFFVRLGRRLQAGRILEVACGNGRVTIPLAAAAAEWQARVTGLELSTEMLDSARSKKGAETIEWIQGDVREWRTAEPFDLIISPCASMSHLLSIEDQLAAWRCAFSNLKPGGRFIVAEVMANLPVLAESMQVPPRVALEMDADRISASSATEPRVIMLTSRARPCISYTISSREVTAKTRSAFSAITKATSISHAKSSCSSLQLDSKWNMSGATTTRYR